MLRIGTAGWAIRREHKASFPDQGSQLTRYAGRLDAVEVNSSFYRPHRTATYARWARETPDGFSFSVKMPRAVTHEAKLQNTEPLLQQFFEECTGLGAKLGCVLVQLAPSLAFDSRVADDFFGAVRRFHSGGLALEPRHSSWFAPAVEEMLVRNSIARVGAHPAPTKLHDKSAASQPGGNPELVYWRLHGSPQIYYSDYDAGFLDVLAARLARSEAKESWCIFDNTALGYATANALALKERSAQKQKAP